jgi:hypothetical protein
MNFLFFFICLFSFIFSQAYEVIGISSEANKISHLQFKEDEMTNVSSVGKDYMDLLNQIGNAQNLSHEKNVLKICSPTCKKIVNGSLWFEGVEHFIPQLLSTGEKVGIWSIEPLDNIPGKDERTVVVRFLVHTEKAGTWNTLVILRCNDQLLITEINEIFNSYEGAH